MQKKRHKGQQKCPIELMSHFVRSHELAKYLQERKTTMTSTALCIYGLLILRKVKIEYVVDR